MKRAGNAVVYMMLAGGTGSLSSVGEKVDCRFRKMLGALPTDPCLG